MANTDTNLFEVKVKDGVSSKTGNAYVYVVLLLNDVELTRIFIKPTELEFYQNLEGKYKLEPTE